MKFDIERLPHYSLRFVGGVCLVLAGLGLWYNITALFTRFPADPGTPYFRHVFYVMTLICVGCYVALAVVGVQFLRLRTLWYKLFVRVIVFEVVYFLSTGLLWSDTAFGHSVGAATGVANGGLMFQFVTLFPLWGPLLARWSTKAIDTPETGDEGPYPREKAERRSDWAWAAVNFVVLYLMLSVLGAFVPQYILSSGSAMGLALLLSLANAYLWLRQRRRRRWEAMQKRREDRLKRGVCPRCEYNLTGNVSGVCPECGERV